MRFFTRRLLLISLIMLLIIGSATAIFFLTRASDTLSNANLASRSGFVLSNGTDTPSSSFTATNMPPVTPTPTATAIPTPTPSPTPTPPPPPPTPTPTPTRVPTAVPPTNTGGSSNHILTGYWQNFVSGAIPLRLSDVSSLYSTVAVAFATADPNNPGAVTFSLNPGLSSALGGYTDAQFTSDIATLHARGEKVIISIGGGNSTIDVSGATSVTNFVNSVYGLIQAYGFDGVDIDIESGIDVGSMTSALQQLSAKVGGRLIITLAPQTIDMQSIDDSYFQLALNIKGILTMVNMQYYNSGTMYGCDSNVYTEGTEDFLTALTCTLIQGGLRPSQIGLGLPGSPAAASGGYTAASVVNQALACLDSGQSCGSFVPSDNWNIDSVMVWSINVDASHSYAFAKAIE